VHSLPPIIACDDDPQRADESLLSVIPRNRRQIYKVRPIIEILVDKGSFFEMGRNFGRSIVAGLARFDGHPVMLFASDPYHNAGSWNAETCQKVVRFADLADDAPLLQLARELAPVLLAQHPAAARAQVARWLDSRAEFLKA
jgi:acetyl-CoA carboxylase carboxyltransferase component